MKQTAVEWLIDQLQKHYVKQDFENTVVFEQAKQMEKEQIIESYCKGAFDISKDEALFPRETSEQYYNETYKSQNNE